MLRNCKCFEPTYTNKKWRELKVHPDNQNRECDAWMHLLEIIEQVAKDKNRSFYPRESLGEENWTQIETLPSEISKLKDVRELILYGSHISRIPPEIGQMTSLESFDPYTSYKLHWLPYEIVHCEKLIESKISTRALYGNYKNRAPFPSLKGNPVEFHDKPRCSVCKSFGGEWGLNQQWVSVSVATDVMPLLAQTCSKECVDKLKKPAKNYIQKAHKGGLGQNQPKREW